MKKTKKRILSLTLCLAMMMAMFSLPAFAVGDGEFDAHDHDCAEHGFVSVVSAFGSGGGTVLSMECSHNDAELRESGYYSKVGYTHEGFVPNTTVRWICTVTAYFLGKQYVCYTCGYAWRSDEWLRDEHSIDHSIWP